MTSVVHSCTSMSFSGLEGYVLDLVTWQYAQAKPVELFCREESPLAEKARSRGIPVWTIGPKERAGPFLWNRMRHDWARRIRNGDVTLHMHAGGEPWFHLPWLVYPTKRVTKSILQYHIWINHKKKDPAHRALFLGIDEVWSSSESARAHLSTLLPVSRDRMRVIPYGRDVRALQDAPKSEWRREGRERLGLTSDDVFALCISRIEPIKGVGELFDAFARIAPKHPKAHLMIVGDPSPENPSAERLGAELRARHAALEPSIRRRLHMPGFVSPVWPLMAAADFYVLPSYEECMSLAMLDAVILGLPVLGTNSGGTPSIARPEETGMLVPPRDVAALSQALERLFADPETCRRLGRGALQLASQLNQEEIFRQIWGWYSLPPASKMIS